MAPLQQFNRSAMGRIADAVRVVESMPGSRKQDGRGRGTPMAREVRWARTTTNAAYPSYPDNGNAVVIEMGDYEASSPYPGTTNSLTFTPYSPEVTHTAICRVGVIPPEGTLLEVWRTAGQWWFNGITWMKGKTNEAISAGSSGECGYYWSTSEIGTVEAYWDWVDGGGGSIASGKEIFLRWYDPGSQWQIVASEC